VDPAAFADVARLGECQPGLPRSGRPAARENVGWGWSMLVSVEWRELYPICREMYPICSGSMLGDRQWALETGSDLVRYGPSVLSGGPSTGV
jgi:hypothetical protein